MTSNQLPLGTPLPHFSLLEPRTGDTVSSLDYQGQPLLIIVMCNHCPYVIRIKEGLVRLGHTLKERGVTVLAISSNDARTHPGDGPEKMAKEAEEYGYPFPYLFDADQAVARSLHAVCTPEFHLFDNSGILVYRGQMDAARPGNDEPNDGKDLLAAVDAVEAGAPPIDPQTPSMGCSIKWRPGKEPDYLAG